MPFPEWDAVTNTLPPFLGVPTNAENMAPYRGEFSEVTRWFGASAERLQILDGLRRFREELRSRGVIGTQWICGSFVENCEVQRGRPPGDVDVITLLHNETPPSVRQSVTIDPRFNSRRAKQEFFVDSFFIDLAWNSKDVVKLSTFWYGLFSHRKVDYKWKGIVEIPLLSGQIDSLSGEES